MKYACNVKLSIMAALGAVIIALSSCSPSKNTAASRKYQAFITRYNVYFNGDEHFNETLKEMEQNYEDDYTQQVFMHPAEAYSHPKSPQPAGSFDRSIEKAQKAIQLHSIKKRPRRKPGKAGSDPAYKAWLKRGEYNPFLHNAWLMMGRSQYFKGDFAGAASTFYYIVKHFTWLPNTVTEAKLWQARSYCALDWLFEAENILVRIKPDELVNSRLKGLYYFTYTDWLVRSKDYKKAIPVLVEAIKYSKGAQKTRLCFLLGQLYAREGDGAAAYEAFKRAGRSSGASYRTKFNARIKQSEVYQGEDIGREVNSLKRMTRYDRNKEYLDQIYYAIGNLYMSRRDTTNAVENYRLAIAKSTRGGIEKAIAQVTLGDIYFRQRRYDLAQPCYSEAVPQLPDDYPDYALLKRRSDVLDELAVYSQNVTLQDSLLELSRMTPEEQMKVAERLIAELKEKEKREAREAAMQEYMAQQVANGSNLQNTGSNAPTQFTINNDDSWYFYNTATRNAGKTDFQKRWGSRKLEDDWRRRDKSSFSMDDFSENSSSEENENISNVDGDRGDGDSKGEKETPHADDPHYPEYYLKQIPKTEAEITTSNDIIQEGLYNMGVILKDKLDDFPAARAEFDRLLNDYPDNVYRLDAYYNLYLLNMRDNNVPEAERYRRLIVSEFSESKYGQAMKDPDYLDKLLRMESEQEALYARTYQDYLDNRNGNVHKAYEDMMRDYPLSPLMPKFMFLHALSYVTEERPDKFNETLKQMLERYPETDMTPLASSYLRGMAQGRKLHSGPVNTRGMLWDIRLTNDSTALAMNPQGEIEFENNPDSPQLLVLLFPTDSISPNQLLYDVARHNFMTFTVRDFDLEMMNFGRLGMLLVKGFSNMKELEHYRRLLTADNGMIIPSGVRPVMISQKNFDALLQGGRSFDDYFKFIGEDTLDKVHEEVLSPEEYPARQEMYPDNAESEELRKEYSSETSDSTIGNIPPGAQIEPPLPPSEQLGPRPDVVKTPNPVSAPNPPAPAKPTPVAPVQPSQPTLPEYPDGSEGDDPLLE